MKKLGYLAAVGVVMAGCGGSGEDSANYPGRLNTSPESVSRATRNLTTGKAKTVTAATNLFGFQLFQELVKKDPAKNIFISPASIAMALQMAYNGAEANTKTSMEKSLGLTGLTLRDINEANKDLRTVLSSPDKGVAIEIANSLWAKEGVEFKREFLGRNEDFFGAKVSSLDFKKEEAADAINVWVNEATHEKIKQIVEKIDPETVLFLINAVYFKGTWKDKFDAKATLPREFTLFDGKKKEVPMMNIQGDFDYFRSDKFASVKLPYGETGRLALFAFLPNEKVSVADMAKQLSVRNWETWLPKYKKTEGKIALPKFKSEYNVQLKDALVALGMEEAFTDKANFTGMADQPPMAISNGGHKTFIEVNEEGTEAAAVTDVQMRPTSMPVQRDTFEFVANRPFFYAIVDKQTGGVLFLGLMGQPE